MKDNKGFYNFSITSFGKAIRIFLVFMTLSGLAADGFAGTEVNKKRRPPNRKRGKGNDREIQYVHGDLFVGLGVNFASGEYFDYQKGYYNTTNPNFLYNGEFTQNSVQMNFGGQVRINPLKTIEGPLSLLGVVIGGSFLQRSFSHKFVLFNDAFSNKDYNDQSTITESFHSSHFLGQFMLRYGYRLFGEVGISSNMFLAGYRKQDLNRFTSGADVFGSEFEVNSSNNFNLTSDVMASGNLGWCFGIGYQIHKYAGIRLFSYFDKRYFKEEPDLSHFQPSVQVLVSY